MSSEYSRAMPCSVTNFPRRSRYSRGSSLTLPIAGSSCPSVWLMSYLVICGRVFTHSMGLAKGCTFLMAAGENGCYVDLHCPEKDRRVVCLLSRLRRGKRKRCFMRSVSDWAEPARLFCLHATGLCHRSRAFLQLAELFWRGSRPHKLSVDHAPNPQWTRASPSFLRGCPPT
jgi:hypothetical protein